MARNKFYEDDLGFERDLAIVSRKRTRIQATGDFLAFLCVLAFFLLVGYIAGTVHVRHQALEAGAARIVGDPKHGLRFEFNRW